jgi:tetratricopeptide (TPR) repeat protein
MRPFATKRISIVLAGSLLATAALAQSVQERRWCEGEDSPSPEQRILSCSVVIRAARDKPEKLAEAHHGRGVGYRLKGELDRAIQDYGQAIKLNGKLAAAYNDRGVAHDRKGDYDRAVQDFDQAIRLRPAAEPYFNRGNAQLGRSQYAAAIDDYNQAIRLKPDFAAAFDNRCWARAVVGILKQALADCNEALRLMPDNPGTRPSRAFVFLKMTHFDAAVSDFDLALQADPKLAFALYGRGLARWKNEDPAGDDDMAAAKALQADIAEEYARYGVQETR